LESIAYHWCVTGMASHKCCRQKVKDVQMGFGLVGDISVLSSNRLKRLRPQKFTKLNLSCDECGAFLKVIWLEARQVFDILA